MKYKVLILGMGNLGKRHLASIVNSNLDMDIYCYDINPNALDDFEYQNLNDNKTISKISTFDDLEEIDFALFAMTSNGRRKAFEDLIEKVKIRNILFEKVLFQNVEDYYFVQKKLDELGIKAWVNCARRQMDCYQILKEELSNAKEMYIEMCGSEWGLACNIIHEIDIIEFLADSNETQIEKLDLLPQVFDSKRVGYKEVYGTIIGQSGKCKKFSITCLRESNVPDIMTISTDIGQFIIIESQNKLIKMSDKNDYVLDIIDFKIPYQSQMTQFVIEDILLSGNSKLTKFHDSMRLHLIIVKPLISFFEKMGMEEGKCPIT